MSKYEKLIEFFWSKTNIITKFFQTLWRQFWQPCAKDSVEVPMTFWSKFESYYQITFSEEKNPKTFSLEEVNCNFDRHSFFGKSKDFPLKVRQKWKYRNFLKQNCSTESSRHLERIFNSFARKFSQTFWKIVDPNQKKSEKVFSPKQNFQIFIARSVHLATPSALLATLLKTQYTKSEEILVRVRK